MFVKPVFIFLEGVVGLFFVFSKKSFIQNKFQNIFLFFVNLLLMLQFVFCWDFNLFPYIFIVSFFILYKSIFFIFPFETLKNKPNLFLNSIISIIFLEILIVLFFKEIKLLQFYFNGSIFSIIIATQILFIVPYLKIKFFSMNQDLNKIYIFLFILFSYVVLFLTKGRAGILGFTIGLLLYNYQYFKSKTTIIKGLIIVLCVSFVMLNFKTSSSNGRLLIYKVLVTQSKPIDLITGIGYGKFRVKYNQFQASYFSTRLINSDEALLADNGYFLYNDLIQLIIEIGLLGLIIIIFGIYKFVVLFRKNSSILKNSPIEFGAYLSCSVIFFSSLFSYPFQVFPIVIHFIFCVAIIYVKDKQNSQKINIQLVQTKFSKLIFSMICFSLIYYGVESFRFHMNSNKAYVYSKNGFRQKSLKIYEEITNGFIKDSDVLFNYAQELEKVKKIDKAVIVIEEASKLVYNDQEELFIARLLVKKNNFHEAENHFKKAVFINPKLFRNRKLLFDFYCDTKQYKKAMDFGTLILELKIKVPSKSINLIRKEIFIKVNALRNGVYFENDFYRQ